MKSKIIAQLFGTVVVTLLLSRLESQFAIKFQRLQCFGSSMIYDVVKEHYLHSYLLLSYQLLGKHKGKCQQTTEKNHKKTVNKKNKILRERLVNDRYQKVITAK